MSRKLSEKAALFAKKRGFRPSLSILTFCQAGCYSQSRLAWALHIDPNPILPVFATSPILMYALRTNEPGMRYSTLR